MKELIMAKYGEIALKGLNKGTFEDILVKNIKRRLRHCGKFQYMRKQSTIYIEPVGEADLDEVMEKLKVIFGIGALQRCAVFEKDFEQIKDKGVPYLEEALQFANTFKV
ncbi:MAG: tRNA 4-thiouridine(8) synthase ThiI, partial [Ruminiclostridium sp.]|nr:tRNA 4-thiouridine(8) synthase ThiI [Ruminiclostridium sp.]